MISPPHQRLVDNSCFLMILQLGHINSPRRSGPLVSVYLYVLSATRHVLCPQVARSSLFQLTMISMEKHILSNWTGNRYQFVTNRYCLVEPASLPKAAGIPVVLILAHGLGLRKSSFSPPISMLMQQPEPDKETWEPFLEDLKRLQENNADLRESGLVTEAWSIDCPSHGDSAILNDHTLVHDSSFHSESTNTFDTVSLTTSCSQVAWNMRGRLWRL